MPLRQFGKELSRGLPALPQDPHLISAPDARLMVSWWNCEVRIWRVKSRTEGSEKPKVVARIALQGQENITSVSISQDGSLLAVATASEAKLFHLAPADSTTGTGLRIRKLELPTTAGARLVRLAADAKWLAVITNRNDVQLVRIVKPEDTSEKPQVLQQLLHLYRFPREEVARDPLNGPWGQYSRSISHAEFSATGNIFAVADVAGFVDTWVVQGHEDSTAPEIDVALPSPTPKAEDEESEDEDDEPKVSVSTFGQRWIRNPLGHLLPQLDSSPLVLSFEPDQSSERPEPNGNPGVHSTRNNRHPHSHDITSTEERLLVVSAKHDLYLFEPLAGKLSEWSRRNPPSSYPSQFKTIHEPAKGCVWDVTDTNRRLWLYGEKWIFMFDLSKDFPLADQALTSSKKRKRDFVHQNPRGKANSGAGDAIPQSEAPVTKLRKFNSGKASGSTWIQPGTVTQEPEPESDEDVDDMAGLRRADGADSSHEDKDEKKRNPETWWHSFKYRPVLGMVPVANESETLEVVLVERPSWDLDLPPRFVGSHE